MSTHLSPPTPTLLLANLPPSSLLGIDLLTLSTPKAPRTFSGIKDLPAGPHFLFTAETPSRSLRSGFWFFVPSLSSSAPPPLILRVWSAESISLVPCNPELIDEAELVVRLSREALMVYQQGGNDNEEWSRLTSHITPVLISKLFGSLEDWTITTCSCSAQDRDDIPGLTASEAREGQERELNMLGIDLKRTWREGAVGRERTEGALDRSWALEDLVSRLDDCATTTTTTSEGGHEEESKGVTREKEWGSLVLGEMEISFLMTLTLSNYSCLEEWKRILSLVLTCSRLLRSRSNFFTTFLRLLLCQLHTADNNVEGGLFSLGGEGEGEYLKGLIKTFRRTVSSLVEDMIDEAPNKQPSDNQDEDEEREGEGMNEIEAAMKDLESWVRDRYGWEFGGWFVRRGGLALEDGEVVEMDVDVDELDELDDAGFFAAAGGGGY